MRLCMRACVACAGGLCAERAARAPLLTAAGCFLLRIAFRRALAIAGLQFHKNLQVGSHRRGPWIVSVT